MGSIENEKADSSLQDTDSEMLETLQRQTFDYFLKYVNPENGLIADKTAPDSPSSIAVVGIGLSCYIVGIERGFISREEAIRRTLLVLKFFYDGKQGSGTTAMGYKGFYLSFSGYADRSSGMLV